MKNAFGGLLHNHRHYTHSWIHRTLVDLLAIQKEIHTGRLRGDGRHDRGTARGPRTMFPDVKNVMLASQDQTAIDAVAAKLMGFEPALDRVHPRRARRRARGRRSPPDRDRRGRRRASESGGFPVGNNGASLVGNLLWFSRLKSLQKLFFRTPLVNVFILAPRPTTTTYRWPMKDRKVSKRGAPARPGAACSIDTANARPLAFRSEICYF
jgi:hypothetical protein